MKAIRPHLEWIIFLTGLILMATMDPHNDGQTFCVLESFGFKFCPGHGLGHSVAFLFRGEFSLAIQSNFMGPFAVVILSFRIIYCWRELFASYNFIKKYNQHV